MNLLAIDQGSHASRALLFDPRGRQLDMAEVPVALDRGEGGRVEQNPEELLAATAEAVRDLLERRGADAAPIAAAGLATQRSTLVFWDARSGRALRPAMHWQDTRCREWSGDAPDADSIARVTGLRRTPHYGAPRIAWALHHDAELRRLAGQGRLHVGPLAAFLLRHLLREKPFAVDVTNASRMLMCDLHDGRWDPDLVRGFGVPPDSLPECRPVEFAHGTLANGVPLQAVAGDQNAALYAQGLPPAESALVNLGSGAFVSTFVDSIDIDAGPLLREAGGNGDFLIEGTVNGAGSALEWARRELGCEMPLAELERRRPGDARMPVFLNRVGGLGSPWWCEGQGGDWIDRDTRPVTPAPVAGLWSVLESVVFMVCANLRWMRPVCPGIRRLRAAGGLARIDGLCQSLADLSGMPVQRFDQTEASARGIAWLAAGRPRDWQRQPCRWFEPGINAGLLARYSRFLQLTDAYARDRN